MLPPTWAPPVTTQVGSFGEAVLRLCCCQLPSALQTRCTLQPDRTEALHVGQCTLPQKAAVMRFVPQGAPIISSGWFTTLYVCGCIL